MFAHFTYVNDVTTAGTQVTAKNVTQVGLQQLVLFCYTARSVLCWGEICTFEKEEIKIYDVEAKRN